MSAISTTTASPTSASSSAIHPWLYLFLIPALAMRLWAEERRSGTHGIAAHLAGAGLGHGAGQIPRRLGLRRAWRWR